MIANFIRTYGRLFVFVTGAAALFYTYSTTNEINDSLAGLPIDGLSSGKKKVAIPPDLGTLPLLLGDSGKRPSDRAVPESPLDLDAAFTPPIVEKRDDDLAPAAVDYFTLLTRELSVSAWTARGAMITGRFCGSHYVAVGQPISGCQYPGPTGQMITPVLVSANKAGLVIREPGSNRTIKVLP